ncbi:MULTISPECIES: hypothetical protein [unclassified Nostoc]|uniref:hypothetical protein n=1 Tax=unclassified Nostoc TaxID=2593658 RepID=UPI000B957EBA|nr:hypothetical protein [Nostoc sp. 'Peltigera membranacea cyanobiont' 232]OYE00490.1 hypothetical protein CDG79_34900 [Nostoc sp. 'Peltigera membranacea cyanobiont' 232]
MLKPNRISIVLAAAALIIVPTLLTAPASAQTKAYSVAQNNQDRDRDGRRDSREDGNPGDRSNLNRDRDGRRNYREDGNGDRNNWNRNGRSYPGEVRNSRDRDNWNRDNQSYSRVVRLGNGDIRYPNGQIIPARSIARLRNQGYFRLPNGDILLPSQEIVPAGRLVRVRDDYFRLPSGLVLQINL